MSDVDEVDYVAGRGPGIPDLGNSTPIVTGGPESSIGAGEPPPEVLRPEWQPQAVEQFLKGTGAGLHWMAGVAEQDWRMTEEDLERITEPLTRMLNRYEPTVRAAGYVDPILVAHGLWLWAWRSALERHRALRAAAEEGDRYVRAQSTPTQPPPARPSAADDVVDGAPEERPWRPAPAEDVLAPDQEAEATMPNLDGDGPLFPQSPLADHTDLEDV